MKSYEGKKITTNFTKKMEQIKTSNTNFKLEPMTLDQDNNFTNVFNPCLLHMHAHNNITQKSNLKP